MPVPAELPEKISETDTLTISGPPALLSTKKGREGLFVREARKVYGSAGLSRAGREAMKEWLAKRGIEVNEDGKDVTRDLHLEACRAAVARGVDPVVALGAAVNAKIEEDAIALPGLVAR